ncbi:hypothetical protein GFK26_13625 [Variovorax paradoxus]|uniref:Uncharacterized protein n=1 Tax=Variovorax paradoxus TaxID=34073 RepID=A0A5Q0M2P6_VARPD|nr:hypothetical protein GFK26_13625 [Variovorax paradoxus]
MPVPVFLPPPLGEGGGGARGLRESKAPVRRPAPIPTFPQRGKEQNRLSAPSGTCAPTPRWAGR